MLTESRIPFHFGVNYIFAPMPVLTKEAFLDLQKELGGQGVNFVTAQREETSFNFVKEVQSPNLQLKIIAGAQTPIGIGQLLIIESQPKEDSTFFIKQAEAICLSFNNIWKQPFQIIKRDVCLRYLYQSKEQHAFQYLWEKRLGQDETGLSALGRPVLGGGLRLVMPPKKDEKIPCEIEVKIESFLRYTKKIFVETQFVWPQPLQPTKNFEPGKLLNLVDSYAKTEVIKFITATPNGGN
ncbi:MAG: hypothetical protein HY811_07295 [Planctomycetes bacterium]|nr:hypothetical protein [Planctomycetota bacterium]